MKNINILFFVLLLTIISLNSYTQEIEKCEISVKITDIKNNRGNIMVGLCNSEKDYTSMGDSFMQDSSLIKKKKAECIFYNVPYGTYAIKVFHDKNGNKTLDLNSFGIPSEDYGFSNNAKGVLGPASWEDAIFKVDSEKITINIKLQ